MPNHYVGDLLHTIGISGLSRVSVWACGPLNLMKMLGADIVMESLHSLTRFRGEQTAQTCRQPGSS